MAQGKVLGKSGGLKINGIIEEYVVASGGNINAGDFVKFVNELGTDTQLSSEYSSGTIISAVALSESKIFIAYSRNPYSTATNYYLNGIVCTLSENTIIAGTPTQLSIMTDSGYAISAVALSEDKVFIAHSYSGDFFLYGMICTIENTSISIGVDTQLSTSRSLGTIISAVLLNENKVFIVHSASGSNSSLYGMICTIENTSITVGTDTLLSSNYGMAISVVSLNSTKVFIAYTRGNNRYLYGLVCTINQDTTITKGTATQLSQVEESGRNISVVGLDNNKVFISHNSDNSNYLLNGLVCTLYEMTITIGIDTQLSDAINSGKTIIAIKLNSNKIFIVHSKSDNYSLDGIYCEIVGTTIKKGLTIQLSHAENSAITISACALSGNKIFVAHSGSTSYLFGISGNINLIEKTESLFEINGIAKTSTTTGNTAQIYVPN